MHTRVCDLLGIEFPIFAFTHCRDVVAAVGKAGGFGVLGAVGFPPEQLEIELKWIDEHIGDRPYGVDIVIPGKYEGMGEIDPVKLEQQLLAAVPPQHRQFADRILEEHGVPKLPAGEKGANQLLGWTAATANPQIDVALRHERVKLIANALGTPPPDVIERIHQAGRLVVALCGAAKQARAHKEAGVDIIVAQGTEGGGHTGEIGSVVLWPEVIDAVKPTPVLAAGGIGTGRQMAAALALGAEGVWTGSIWLTVQEAESPPAQVEAYLAATSRDTVRSRSFTGKPCRMLRNDWTEAWERPDAPKPLGMPLQFMVTADAVSRGHRYADKAKQVMFNPVGQIVGRMNAVRPVREVMREMVEECIDTVSRVASLLEQSAGG
jgi:NAD(P)H-dependent flavin oxidoreductase YrpB (nitropropane dioxygenase family)